MNCFACRCMDRPCPVHASICCLPQPHACKEEAKLESGWGQVIMLLKGNVKQVSFLHVYHHVSISCIWWAIAYAAPGGDGAQAARAVPCSSVAARRLRMLQHTLACGTAATFRVF